MADETAAAAGTKAPTIEDSIAALKATGEATAATVAAHERAIGTLQGSAAKTASTVVSHENALTDLAAVVGNHAAAIAALTPKPKLAPVEGAKRKRLAEAADLAELTELLGALLTRYGIVEQAE